MKRGKVKGYALEEMEVGAGTGNEKNNEYTYRFHPLKKRIMMRLMRRMRINKKD